MPNKKRAETKESLSAMDGAEHDGDLLEDVDAEKSSDPDFATKVATIGVIAVGVALIEVSLIPGMVIGLAAALAPKYVPGLRPLLKSTVRGAVKLAYKTRETISEASEQVQDIMAEAKLEDEDEAAASESAAGASTAH
jgi:hypothetical protein